MIVGQNGTGRTSFVENLIRSRFPVTRLQVSPTLTPTQLQEFILDRVHQLDKRAGQRLTGGGRGATKSPMKCMFFLDDIHLASSTPQRLNSSNMEREKVEGEVSLHSPVLELARFAVQQHQLIDFSRSYHHSLNNMRYIASCTSWEYWKLPHRFSHNFNPIPFLAPSDDCLHQVFCCSVLQWLKQFPDTAIGGEPEPLAEVYACMYIIYM